MIKIIVPNINIQIINYIFKIISSKLKNIKFELYDTHILPSILEVFKTSHLSPIDLQYLNCSLLYEDALTHLPEIKLMFNSACFTNSIMKVSTYIRKHI